MEALDAAKEEKEIRAKELEKQKVNRKEKPFKEKMNRKVSFNSIVRVRSQSCLNSCRIIRFK